MKFVLGIANFDRNYSFSNNINQRKINSILKLANSLRFREIDTANNYSLDISTNGDGQFKFYFKVENLKLMDGSYDVSVSSRNISNFKSKNSDVEYWIALEPESTYSV